MTNRLWIFVIAATAVVLAVPGSVILLVTFSFAWGLWLLALAFFHGSACAHRRV
jgi:hypothetical protein